MIKYTLDTANAILYLHPISKFEADDFVQLAKVVDPYIEASGSLAGIIIEAPTFPGWENLDAMLAHLSFVREHHQHIKKIALLTESNLGNVAEHIASHFVSAEIKHFATSDAKAAKEWISNS